LCLAFPDWAVQRLLVAQPELGCAIFVLTETNGRTEFVHACNPLARKRGIAPGMPLSEVLTQIRPGETSKIAPLDPAVDRAALVELAMECERYSPCVGLEEAECPESLLLDITGIAHLFGGEEALAHQVCEDFSARRFGVKIAIGDSIGMAWAAARFLAHVSQPLVIPVGQHDLLRHLPLEGLRLSDPSIQKLHRLGIRTIHQVFRLPRASLPSRFGNEIAIRLDQFTGRLPEVIQACRPMPKPIVERSFENGLRNSEVIEHVLSVLLRELLSLLRPRQAGIRQLHCLFMTDAKNEVATTLRLCRPVADAQQLQELLQLKLERLRFDAPVVRIRLEALEVLPLGLPQRDLLHGHSPDDARQFASLVNRLSSRLGDQAVVSPKLLCEAIPEQAVALVPVAEELPSPPRSNPQTFRPLDRPTCLFARPQPVEVVTVVPDGPPAAIFLQGRRWAIARHWGPEQIDGGGWQGPVVRRQYYRIELTDGRRLWLFQRLSDERWFLHGEFS
jgi:protein ImuB